MKKCGDFHRFQFVHYIFLNLFSIYASIVAFYYVFAAAEPDHRCRLFDNIWLNDNQYYPINRTHEIYIRKYLDKNCFRRFVDNQIRQTCANDTIYDRSIFGYTFTEEANLICENKSRKSWLATAAQCAGFLSIIIGTLADKYGRKRLIILLTIPSFCICFLTQIILQWIPLTVDSKFFILLLNQFASGLFIPIYMIAFILILELTTISHRSSAGNLAFIAYTIGEILIAIFAYFTRDWLKFKWTNTIAIGLVLPYLYFMPESPMYFYAKKDYVRLEELLKRIAKMNRKNETNWYESYQDLIRQQTNQITPKTNSDFHRHQLKLLCHPKIFIQLIVSASIGFHVLLFYIQISYGLTMLNMSPYLLIIIGAIVESLSYLVSSCLISTRFGRKGSFIIMMSLTIICLILIPTMKQSHSTISILFAQIGKFTISATTGIICIFVPEIFPTSIRTTTNGLFFSFSRFGVILVPILHTLIPDEYSTYTFYCSALLGVLILLSSLILPETKSKCLDDTHITDV